MTTRLTKYLLGAQSDDSLVRREALTTLGQLRDQGLPQFLLSLSKEVSDDSQPTTSRRFAGMILMKCLDAKESVSRKDQLLELWVEMDMDFKSQIKHCMLDTLGSSSFEANHTAAKVIAQIYSIEIPRKEWPELFERLFANITQIDKSESLKRASLLTFHYIGKICNKELLKNEVDVVMTSMEDESIKETTSRLLSRILKFGPSIVSSTITGTPSCSDDEEQSHTTIFCVKYDTCVIMCSDGRGTNGKTGKVRGNNFNKIFHLLNMGVYATYAGNVKVGRQLVAAIKAQWPPTDTVRHPRIILDFIYPLIQEVEAEIDIEIVIGGVCEDGEMGMVHLKKFGNVITRDENSLVKMGSGSVNLREIQPPSDEASEITKMKTISSHVEDAVKKDWASGGIVKTISIKKDGKVSLMFRYQVDDAKVVMGYKGDFKVFVRNASIFDDEFQPGPEDEF